MGDAIFTRRLLACLAALICVLSITRTALSAVSLTLLDSSMGTSRTYSSGSTFTLTVFLSLSSTSDSVAGIDYQVYSTLNGNNVKGVFSLLGRTTTPPSPDASGSTAGFISDPDVPDQNTAGSLNPNNNVGLGGSNLAGYSLTGVHSNNNIATLQFRVNSVDSSGNNIQYGKYLISFYMPGVNTEYSSLNGMNYTDSNFNTLGSYMATVPEPASTIGGLALLGMLAKRRRCDASRR